MRYTVAVLKCGNTNCGKMLENVDEKVLPKGWYHVRIPTEKGHYLNGLGENGFDFCCLGCLVTWAKGRGDSLGIPVKTGPVYRKRQCPYCEKSVAPQGFRGHYDFAHTAEASFEEAKKRYYGES